MDDSVSPSTVWVGKEQPVTGVGAPCISNCRSQEPGARHQETCDGSFYIFLFYIYFIFLFYHFSFITFFDY